MTAETDDIIIKETAEHGEIRCYFVCVCVCVCVCVADHNVINGNCLNQSQNKNNLIFSVWDVFRYEVSSVVKEVLRSPQYRNTLLPVLYFSKVQ